MTALIVSPASYPNAKYTRSASWNLPRFVGAMFPALAVTSTDATFGLPGFDPATLERIKAMRFVAIATLLGKPNSEVRYQRRAIWNGADVFESWGADRYSKFDGAGRLRVEYEFEIDKPTELDGPWSGPALALTLYWTPMTYAGLATVDYGIDPNASLELLAFRTSGRRITKP